MGVELQDNGEAPGTIVSPKAKSTPLRILHLEDNPHDSELIGHLFAKAGIDVRIARVDNEEKFSAALEEGAFDLILSDYSLPTFDGLVALQLALKRRPDKPFILFSGTIGEEAAVDVLKSGAADYVLKDRPARLLTAVQKALCEARDRAAVEMAKEILEKTQRQLVQAQKMEAIGRLAGGLAHDFNNLLTVILGQSDLVLTHLPADSPIRKDLEEIRLAADRATSLTRQLLIFSRRDDSNPKPVNVNQSVAGIAKLLKRLIGEDIDLRTRLDPDVKPVRVDAGQLEQAILNLAVNARDAMPGGGTLSIETHAMIVDEKSAGEKPGLGPGPYALIVVRDTGTGIREEILPHIFEPFFTTKPKEKGTGLGLSMVYGFVTQNGGTVSVSSEPGRGSAFSLYLPQLSEKTSRKKEARVGPDPVPKGRERVLLAEDDEMVRAVAQTFLKSCGYKVLAARNGKEAWESAGDALNDYDLLVTDIVMPDMGGRELAVHIHERRPDFKVLFMSGYSSETIGSLAELPAGSDFIRKPFSLSELARRVREILDQPK